MTGSKKITIKTQLQDYSESEFLELLRKVFDADFPTPDEYDNTVHEVVRLADHPKGTDIIFYPEPGVDDSPEGTLEFIKVWRAANGLPDFKSYNPQLLLTMAINSIRPAHPGEVLREEFLEPLGITPVALARALHVSEPIINDIVRERCGITADTAIRLSRYFDTSARFWMNLQTEYALATTYAESGEAIEQAIKPLQIAS